MARGVPTQAASDARVRPRPARFHCSCAAADRGLGASAPSECQSSPGHRWRAVRSFRIVDSQRTFATGSERERANNWSQTRPHRQTVTIRPVYIRELCLHTSRERPSQTQPAESRSARSQLRPDPSAGERHEDLQEQLKPSNGGVFSGLNGIVIKSHAGSTPRVSQTPSIPVTKMALQELHSKVRQTIASAVRRRGNKRRTLWRGVTTRLGQP